MAARLNFGLQACVVRRRFARRSRYDSSSLAQFVDSIVADDVMEQSPDDRAQILARALARLRPELDLYLMTEVAVEDLAGRSATTSGASSTPGKARSSCTCPSWTGSRAVPDAVFHRAEGTTASGRPGVPRAADLARQVDHRVALDPATCSISTA